jgi:two-component system, OmpR family, phosphate regulon sensor histidine kinase PhoR
MKYNMLMDELYSATVQDSLERERLNSLIQSMGDGVIAIDEKLKVVVYNGAALDILDSNSSMTGQDLADVFKPLDTNYAAIDMVAFIRDLRLPKSTRDWCLKYHDESVAKLYVSISPVRLGYGQKGMQGYVLLIRDITREKSLEEERDEFISVVSHELRTPIAIAEGNLGNAQYIVEKDGDITQVKEALKQAYNQIIFLSGMINDLSTLSRAERGKLTMELEDINMRSLIDEISKNYQPQAAKKNLQLLAHCDPTLESLKSSKLYVREILQNFVTNAIKYTESGNINISAKSKEGGVEVTVSDTGIGISKSDQEKVFDKFFRSEDFRTRQNNGTGLGLYVTAKLARLLHADINLSSELNKGSTFTVFLPNLQAN